MTTPTHRWYHPTPDRYFVGLLAVQVLLFLSDRFDWLPFNEKKGWTVLIAVGVVGVAVVVMLIWGLVCLCLRRRFQFGVRSLLVFLVAVSVSLGWFAWEMQRARRQKEDVEAILGMGGSVSYDYRPNRAFPTLFHLHPQPTTPAWLRKLLGHDFFCEVLRVNVQRTEYGDDDAKTWKGLTKLELLWLDGTQITDRGLGHLQEMTKLEELSLDETQITDSGLAHLERLTELKSLSLDDMTGLRLFETGSLGLFETTQIV
jgi:hypothetical protein